MLRSLEGDRQLYISEFQTDEALILKVFDDSATTICGTDSNNMSDAYNMLASK